MLSNDRVLVVVPMDTDIFGQFFDQDKRLINEHEFRKVIFKGGIKSNIRVEAWKFLFQYYSYNSTPRERENHDLVSHIDYTLMKLRWQQINDHCKDVPEATLNKISIPMMSFDVDIRLDEGLNSKANIDYIKIQSILKISRQKIDAKMLLDDVRQIDKDVPRTAMLNSQITEDDDSVFHRNLRDILITFAAFHQNVNNTSGQKTKQHNLGYTQGMNELASIFLSVFDNASIAYWCFSNFMLMDLHTSNGITLNTVEIVSTHALKTNVAHYFSDTGIGLKLKQLSKLLNSIDVEFYAHLKELNLENLYFCHEWLLLFFKRLFKTTPELYLECFEKLSSHFVELNTALMSTTIDKRQININSIFTFDLFICLSLLTELRPAILECTSDIDVYNIVRVNASGLIVSNFNSIFTVAEQLFHSYCKAHMSTVAAGSNATFDVFLALLSQRTQTITT